MIYIFGPGHGGPAAVANAYLEGTYGEVYPNVGEDEAETGPLATAWHSNKFFNPVSDGTVLPILHLNGCKIANPTVLTRIPPEEPERFPRGCGWDPHSVRGSEPEAMHRLMAVRLDAVGALIARIGRDAREHGAAARPLWPMIVPDSPKGWTGPKLVNGKPIEDTFRAHQMPLPISARTRWTRRCRAYRASATRGCLARSCAT